MATEKRLIDANALEQEFRAYMVERYDREKCFSEENCKTCDRPCLWWRKVNEAPTVDAVEVVHARWTTGRHCYECSACKNGYLGLAKTKYCPNCGAKMEGGSKYG